MKPKTDRKKALTYRLRYDESNLGRFIDLACSPARKSVVLTRQQKDALDGRAGSTVACMNAKCATRLAAAFPHPVYLAVFTKTSAYIVDKITEGKQPKHCIWYHHDDREAIGIHDRLGPQAVIDAGLADRTIRLRPPKSVLGRAVGSPNSQRDPSEAGPKKVVMPLGARRRAREAGLFFPP